MLVKKISCNNFDSDGNVNVEFDRNGVQVFRLENDTEPRLVLPWGNSLETPTILCNYIDPRALDADIFFRGGDVAGTAVRQFFRFKRVDEELNISVNVVGDNGKKKIVCNNFNSNGDNDIVFQRNGEDYLSLTTLSENKRVVCPNDVDFICQDNIKCNNYNSNGDNDISFRRNNTEYLKFTKSTISQDPFVLLGDTVDISSRKCFANEFSNRSYGQDTIFYGSNSSNTARVEYMRYNRTGVSVDFNCALDNTGLNVIGNIIDTTVSDERLKENIEVINTDFSDCVKNVPVKKFNYKDEKYKKNDTFGFIAQELLKALPEEFKGIVKENKEKHSDETYLSINYMKLSVILWGCNQELIKKIEYLESSVYELQEEMKELKKPKPKTRAKATTTKN